MLIDKNKALGKLQMLDIVGDQLHPATIKACVRAIREIPGIIPDEGPNMETIHRALGIIEGISFMATGSEAEALTCAREMIEDALGAAPHET